MQETHKWLFVCDVPLLYEKDRVAKQFKVEMWLDFSPLIRALDLKPFEPLKPKETRYIA